MRFVRSLLFALTLATGVRAAAGQAAAGVDYTLRIDTTDLSGVAVRLERLIGNSCARSSIDTSGAPARSSSTAGSARSDCG